MNGTHELIYYKSGKAAPLDFTDDAVLTPSERRAFLDRYAAFVEKAYDLPSQPTKVIDPSEADALAAAFEQNAVYPQLTETVVFDRMNGSLQPTVGRYRGWQLYTAAARVEDGTLVFDRKEVAPTPSAAYRLPGGRLKHLSLTFTVSGEYAVDGFGKVGDVTPGKTVELRCGVRDVVKLGLYASGEVVARLAHQCPYHPQNVVVGHFAFDRPQKLELWLDTATYTVKVGDEISQNLPLSYEGDPDLLFADSGMFHVGDWRITPELLETATATVTDFFLPEAGETPPAESLGEVKLPFAVGGYANRDKRLILEKDFAVSAGRQATLEVTSLDPGGRVFINGRLAAETDGFDRLCLNVTELLQEGNNRLRLEVDPRGPQSLYNWHRQQDNYVGWFCDTVKLTLVNRVAIDQPTVETLSVEGGKVRARVRTAVSAPCKLQVYLRPLFPTSGEEIRIGAFAAEGAVDRTLTFTAAAWSPETPIVYALRAEALVDGVAVDDAVVETGFRMIEQKNGELRLNGERLVMTGALTMQLLPPHEETPITHICPQDGQVAWQLLMTRAMGGNTLRLHVLGYGNNDRRFARYADRLGLLLIWTTRHVDSVEQMQFQPHWAAREAYLEQIRPLRSHPSIVMWEGANEYHPTLSDIDRICEQFVPAVKAVDATRLLCPISHLYYAGDFYPTDGCAYYNDAGTADHNGNPATASPYWTDPLVVRSAHPYSILLGYGSPWADMREQAWSGQPELLQNRKRAYLASEYAIIGRPDPTVPEAATYFNAYSYEFPNEDVLGFRFSKEEWRPSQAWQALAAHYTTKQLRLCDADGMLWCCLLSGANDGGYLKPPIDMYGYPKLAFYALREMFAKRLVTAADVDPIKSDGFAVAPVVFGTKRGERLTVTVAIADESGREIARTTIADFPAAEGRTDLPVWHPSLPTDGIYRITYTDE